jgi:hypothetical protein
MSAFLALESVRGIGHLTLKLMKTSERSGVEVYRLKLLCVDSTVVTLEWKSTG